MSTAVAHQQALMQVLPLAAVSLQRRAASFDPKGWRSVAHSAQRPPEGDWATWYIRGGRGGGKTWTGSHTLAEWMLTYPGEYAVVGPTYADARDTCIEGANSGLLAALGTNRAEVDRGASRLVVSWNRSIGDMRLRNGSVVWADGADDGASTIQGKNLNGLWADEVGLWKRWQMAWEESIRYAVRLAPARIVATGTPKRGHPLVKLLVADDAIPKTVLPTMGNAANLDPTALATWLRLYGGTTLGRQELEGETLNDAERALWTRALIRHLGEDGVPEMPRTFSNGVFGPHMRRMVVAIDPAVTSEAGSDETGILVAGVDHNGLTWVHDDVSDRVTPNAWAQAAVAAYHRHLADRIIGESNNGGEMVRLTIHTADANVPVKLVHASHSKQARAEPVQALYEQGKVIHVRAFPELEDQMCNWEPQSGDRSPDRLDALVWAVTDLVLGKGWGAVSGVGSGVA